MQSCFYGHAWSPRSSGAKVADMRNLAETEAAADVLPLEEKQELFLFVAMRLRAQRGSLPQPRKLSGEQVAGWSAEDEADLRRRRERA